MDSLGDRMKEYENVNRTHLTKRLPVIIRIDGRSFHTLTRSMQKPFDKNFILCMQQTLKDLVKNIDTCVFGYCQSDEISLLLINYKNLNTEAWFKNNIQKIVSISASIATASFNKYFSENFILGNAMVNFDSRVFTLPKEEVVNYFIWRQNDATRNSIQMLARSNFSHKELHKKSCNDIQEMLFSKKGINYNDLETYKKRGTCCYYENQTYILDYEIPIFTQDRKYIEKFVNLDCIETN